MQQMGTPVHRTVSPWPRQAPPCARGFLLASVWLGGRLPVSGIT